MRPRAPYAMTTLADELVDLNDCLCEFLDPDGVGIIQTLRVTTDDTIGIYESILRTGDSRIREAKLDDEERIIVNFRGDLWSRSPFGLRYIYEALNAEEDPKPAKKTTRKTTKKAAKKTAVE